MKVSNLYPVDLQALSPLILKRIHFSLILYVILQKKLITICQLFNLFQLKSFTKKIAMLLQTCATGTNTNSPFADFIAFMDVEYLAMYVEISVGI